MALGHPAGPTRVLREAEAGIARQSYTLPQSREGMLTASVTCSGIERHKLWDGGRAR